MNSVNCIKKSEGAITLSEANLFSRNSFIMEPYSCYQDQDYNHIIHTHKMIPIDLEIVYEGIKNLKECTVVLENTNEGAFLCYYNRGWKIWSEALEKKIEELLPNNDQALKIEDNKLYQFNISTQKKE